MMVYPPITTDSTSRSSFEQSTQSALCQSQSPVPSLLLPHHQNHHHHQQQHQPQQKILYAPYNTIPNCIPPTNHPQCIYQNTQRNLTNTVTLRSQGYSRGVKNTKWKSRPVRVKEHQPNPNLHHSLPYAPPPPPPPPLVLYDPIQSHLSTTPAAPITPIYINPSSTLFNHGGVYSNENYTNFTPNVITQPYYKPPEVQNFCLIDRPSSQTAFIHHQTIPPGSNYYNSTSNTNRNQQNIKSFVTSTSNVYSSVMNNDSRIIATTVAPTQIFPNSLNSHGFNVANYSTDKLMENFPSSISNELSTTKCSEKILIDKNDCIMPGTDRLFTVNIDIESEKLSGMNIDNIGVIQSRCDERFSDESSNFDFTIEAEKMVSALCNTTSCELDKDENEQEGLNNMDKKIFLPKNNNELDKCQKNIKKSYKPWYFGDFSSETKLPGESIGTQTTDTPIGTSQYPELIRKTIYWGCNEADKIMKNSSGISPRQSWLQNLSSATKIALTKSSTCFPIFSGDKIFSQDLINSLLRVSNGWLILDHYLNKHHHPNLNDKYDNELIESFKKWEMLTNNLLESVIKTFIKLEMSNFSVDENTPGNTTIDSSFPGDISLYVNYGLFGDPPVAALPFPFTPRPVESKSATLSTRKCPYMNNDNRERKNRWSTGKESKLRTKWTITEHSRASTEVTNRNHDEKYNWNLFPKGFPINRPPLLVNTIEPQQKLHCNFFISQSDDNSTNSKQLTNFDSSFNTETVPNDENLQLWDSCGASSSLYKFAHDTHLNDSNNKITLMNQVETQKAEPNGGKTINLSAWFASMRNKRSSSAENSSSTWAVSTPAVAPTKFRESSSVSSSFRMDSNRQLRTLKNMRTIQCAPWTANHLMDDHQSSKPSPDEYDSSEDVRVYMKPGSYNVPKKRNQSRRSQRRDSSTTRNNRQSKSNKGETSCLTYSVIGARSNVSSSSSSTCSQDVQNKDATWKAACASAGLLLNALKAKENSNSIESHKIANSTPKHSENSAGHHSANKNKKHRIGFELSGDDFESLKLSSLDTSDLPRDDHEKRNIKTDSWLIRTLNNVTNETNAETKQSRDEDDDEINILPREKSLKNDGDDKKTETRSISLETSHTIAVMTAVDVVGKATYSETVRRFSSATKSSSCSATRIIQQKNGELEKIDNNYSCPTDESKKEEQAERIKPEDVKMKSNKTIKLKKNRNCNDERDWSIWYSSKRKHHNNSLGQAALGKLVNIHRALWRMDGTRVLKGSTINTKTIGTDNTTVQSINMENYRKILKSPMFLETIGYKLKNHEYRKVENAIRDFKRVIHNSKLYHKNDNDCMERIENLSKKLEELVQQNFADELSLQGNCSPIRNRQSPNRFIMSSSTNTIINSVPPTTTVVYNGDKETPLIYRRSTRIS